MEVFDIKRGASNLTWDVTIIGAGVAGLSCGILLQESGLKVRIFARELSPYTTSDKAAAVWLPFHAEPADLVAQWSGATYEELCRLAGQPGTGISLTPGIVLHDGPTPDPIWCNYIPDFRRPMDGELPADYGDGFVFDSPIIEMPIYLGYLKRRFQAGGGVIILGEITSLEEVAAGGDIVVNCSGLGARELVGDEMLFPIRGQIVRVERASIAPRWLLGEGERHGIVYVIPRSKDCVLGGTAVDGDWSLEPDMTTAASIIERCAQLVPAVGKARIVDHVVGLRPGRHAVRLESEFLKDGSLVIHNYGHGGAGVTMSWGCAAEVAGLVAAYRLAKGIDTRSAA